ncbi:hypothetical protein RYX36_019079, partial [Vicia faba]
PLSSSLMKRKCSSETLGSGKCGNSSSHCHCSKKSRKLRLKRVVRVPAISLKMTDIPPDDYSWRKYGQKPIKGSPHPRGYYKCSNVRGCLARKQKLQEHQCNNIAQLFRIRKTGIDYASNHHQFFNHQQTSATTTMNSSNLHLCIKDLR